MTINGETVEPGATFNLQYGNLVDLNINLTRTTSKISDGELIVELPKIFTNLAVPIYVKGFNISVVGNELKIKGGTLDNNSDKAQVLGGYIKMTAEIQKSTDKVQTITINGVKENVNVNINNPTNNPTNSPSGSGGSTSGSGSQNIYSNTIQKLIWRTDVNRWANNTNIPVNNIVNRFKYEVNITGEGKNIKNAMVADIIPVGGDIDTASISIVNLETGENVTQTLQNNGDIGIQTVNGQEELLINFTDLNSNYQLQYSINFSDSEINKLEEQLSNNPNLQYTTVTNTAYLFVNGESVNSSSAQINIWQNPNKKPVVFNKTITGSSKFSSIGQKLSYSLNINQNFNNLSGVRVIDKLPNGLKVLPSSIYALTQGYNGYSANFNIITGNIPPDDNEIYKENTIVVSPSGNMLYIYIGNTNYQRYTITYQAEITAINQDNIVNKATMYYDDNSLSSSATATYTADGGSIGAWKTVNKSTLTDDESQDVVYGIHVNSYGVFIPNYLNISDTLEQGIVVNNVNVEGYDTNATEANGVYTKEEDGIEITYGINADGRYFVNAVNNEKKFIEGTDIVLDIDASLANIKNGTIATNTAVINNVSTNTVSTKKGYAVEGVKVSSENTNQTLQGAVYDIYSSSNTLLGEVTSGKNGEIYFTVPNAGEYYLKEVTAPKGYAINPNNIYFTVTSDDIGTIDNIGELKDSKIAATVVIKKTNESGEALAGATIEILNSNNEVVYTGITNSEGEVSCNLPYGSYTYKEVKAPIGYEINNNLGHFTIDNSMEIVEIIKDKKIPILHVNKPNNEVNNSTKNNNLNKPNYNSDKVVSKADTNVNENLKDNTDKNTIKIENNKVNKIENISVNKTNTTKDNSENKNNISEIHQLPFTGLEKGDSIFYLMIIAVIALIMAIIIEKRRNKKVDK